jgi:hypothetical protein
MQEIMRQTHDAEISSLDCEDSLSRNEKLDPNDIKQIPASDNKANLNSTTHKTKLLNARIALQSLTQRTGTRVSYLVADL